MNDIDEPRRLFESDDAPAELRGLLAQAHADVTSDATAERLLRAAERRVSLPVPRAPWAARHAGKLFLAAAVLGVGAGVGYWSVRASTGLDGPRAPGAGTLAPEAPQPAPEATVAQGATAT